VRWYRGFLQENVNPEKIQFHLSCRIHSIQELERKKEREIYREKRKQAKRTSTKQININKQRILNKEPNNKRQHLKKANKHTWRY